MTTEARSPGRFDPPEAMTEAEVDATGRAGAPPLRGRRETMRLALVARLRAYFFAGILITSPIAITVYLAWLFVSFVDSRVTPLIPERFNPGTYLPFAIPGLGLLIVVIALIVIGASTAGYFGRLLTRSVDAAVVRMPVVRSIYVAVKQIMETVLARKSNAFRQAVLVQYPRTGVWTIAFLTGVTQGEVRDLTSEEMINVFVPTTPNPTSGFLLFVPRSDVIPLSMSVEDALKMVVSGGLLTPPPPPAPTSGEHAAAESESADAGAGRGSG
jgi:uncharacterized membrane protein